MASKPSPCTVTVGQNNQITNSPDPVVVNKTGNSAHDGVQWTLNNEDWVFTGVTINNVSYTPGSPGSGDFSGLTIDNTQPNGQNKKSIMTIDDSLAEIANPGDQMDYSYGVEMQERAGTRTMTFDPKIRNKW